MSAAASSTQSRFEPKVLSRVLEDTAAAAAIQRASRAASKPTVMEGGYQWRVVFI